MSELMTFLVKMLETKKDVLKNSRDFLTPREIKLVEMEMSFLEKQILYLHNLEDKVLEK